MIQNNQLDLHPETERRKQDLDLLKAEYTNQWNNRQVLLEWGKPQLCALYTLRIGRLQIDLLEQRAALLALSTPWTRRPLIEMKRLTAPILI